MTTKLMGMLLQDPSAPDLFQDYEFPIETDFLAGMSSSKISLQDTDEYGSRLYQGLDWATADLSFATLNKKGDFIDNPQFHQVNTFAATAYTLGLVESAIGREMKWKHNAQLILRPHAFDGPNAYYDPMSPSLNFGSFTSPFRRAPIWTCLSHDIVSHELGHAILDSFRPQYVYSEEVDTGAIHESVGDMMSMFTALSHKPVVEHLYRESGGDMMNPNLASGLAEEFGIGLWGVSFPFLRSALSGPNYDQASSQVHARSTVWTAAIYEILATMVAESLTLAVKATLENAPSSGKPQAQMNPIQQMMIQQHNPVFEDYYADQENHDNFDVFFDAIVSASTRVKGMMLRALQDIPPTGVTMLTLARVFYNADARLFPDDPNPRELAKAVFQRRMLWIDEIDLSAPGVGANFEEAFYSGSNTAMLKAVYENAEALRIPMGEGARILNARISTVTRTIDAGSEQRGSNTKTVTERYLYFTYEMVVDICPEFGWFMNIAKGGTLVIDENWNDLQLTTDPDTYLYPEGGENGEGGEPVGARMLRMAKQRFTRIHHRSLRAFRDGLVDADGHLPSGEHALPFKIAKQSSGATRPVRHRCNLKEHLLGIAGKHASFPFDVD